MTLDCPRRGDGHHRFAVLPGSDGLKRLKGWSGKIDQTKCGIGRPRKLGRQIVGDELSAATFDRTRQGPCIGLEIGELVCIEHVADGQGYH